MRILGIDPGTSTFGTGVMDVKDGKITDIISHTINPMEEFRNDLYSDRYKEDLDALIRTTYIIKALDRMIDSVKPDLCAIETPFINMRMPNSYVILAIHFDMIKNCLYRKKVLMFPFAPQTIKASLGCAGKKGKDIVKTSFMGIHELNDNVADLDVMSEHEIDAVAACYCLLKKARNGELQ